MDPVLARRLAQQQQKTITGESAVECLSRTPKGGDKLDPKLAQRLAQQQRKTITGESAVEGLGQEPSKTVSLEGGDLSQLEPKLASRLSMQRRKMIALDSASTSSGSGVTPPEEPVADEPAPEKRFADPVLARRMAQQRDKAETGKSAIDQVGSAAEKAARIDPALLRRLSAQSQKVEEGKSTTADIGARREQRTATSFSVASSELAEKLNRRRSKEESFPESADGKPNSSDAEGLEIKEAQEKEEPEVSDVTEIESDEAPIESCGASVNNDSDGKEVEKNSESEVGDAKEIEAGVAPTDACSTNPPSRKAESASTDPRKAAEGWTMRALGAALCRCCS